MQTFCQFSLVLEKTQKKKGIISQSQGLSVNAHLL